MTIYFARSGNAVKIGFTASHAWLRTKNLQTACPGEITIIRAVEGGKDVEDRLHKQFADRRLRRRGEWFEYCPTMMGDLGLVDLPTAPPVQPTPAPKKDELLELLIEVRDAWVSWHGAVAPWAPGLMRPQHRGNAAPMESDRQAVRPTAAG
jgi:Meiotically up-regulated gene 113